MPYIIWFIDRTTSENTRDLLRDNFFDLGRYGLIKDYLGWSMSLLPQSCN